MLEQNSISLDELNSFKKDEYLLIDIREDDAYQHGCIDGPCGKGNAS